MQCTEHRPCRSEGDACQHSQDTYAASHPPLFASMSIPFRPSVMAQQARPPAIKHFSPGRVPSLSRQPVRVPDGVLPTELQHHKAYLGFRDAQKVRNGKAPRGNIAHLFPDLMLKGLRGDNSRPAGGAGRRPGLVWFRSDLRLHDNEALVTANKECSSLLFVYCFDSRDYGKQKDWWTRTIPHQARFLLDCVADLRSQLRDLGSELIVRFGRPEQVLAELVRKAGAAAVFCEEGPSASGAAAEVAAAVEAEGARLRPVWGSSTLFHSEDLPFRVADTPATLGAFKDRVAALPVRRALAVPSQLRGLPLAAEVPCGDIPTLQQLGVDATKLPEAPPSQPAMPRGGEREALARLRQHVERLKAGGSEPLSKSLGVAFLAMGCLSPRRIYSELRAFLPPNPIATSQASKNASSSKAGAGKRKEQKGSVLVVYELLWRDFFRFQAKQCALLSKIQQQPQQETSSVAPQSGLPLPALAAT